MQGGVRPLFRGCGPPPTYHCRQGHRDPPSKNGCALKRVEVKVGGIGIVAEGFDDLWAVMTAISACLRGLRAREAVSLDEVRPEEVRPELAGRTREMLGVARPSVGAGAPGPTEPTPTERTPTEPTARSSAAPEAQAAPEPGRPASVPIDEAVLERIFDWANQQLSMPEALGRREAMASLRAAATATNAERHFEAKTRKDDIG